MDDKLLAPMSSFLEYLRPTALRDIMDRKAGISPEQRISMDEAAAVENARIDALAKQALAKLTYEEAEAVSEYFSRDC